MSAGLGEAVYLCGEITDSRRELWANVTYLLGCPVYVRDGATLVLEPGTMIAAVPKDPSHPDVPVLVVERGGRIIADCSAERPCTFTAANPGETESNEQVQTDSSSSATVVYGARGKWGGVVLAGRAVPARRRGVPGAAAVLLAAAPAEAATEYTAASLHIPG